jgi:acetoin utilization deacetylase AcuC-like enzyme
MLLIAWSPIYAHSLPEGHRFPMEKYNLIPEQLLYEGTITAANLFEPQAIAEADILLTHDADYWARLKGLALSAKEARKIGFPMSAQLIERECIITQGTLDCARLALRHGIAMNVSGGTHHAFRARGEGFCLLNDIAVAANCLLRDGLASRILVIDLDVHQGNGTAEIFRAEPRVFTFSMHCEGNYPLEKEQSSRDIGLAPGTATAAYLQTLSETLPDILAAFRPDFVFYLSGVDILETDKLGRLAVTRDGCLARDRYVLTQVRALGIPLCISMGGGYSHRISDIVEAHCNTFRLAQQLFF